MYLAYAHTVILAISHRSLSSARVLKVLVISSMNYALFWIVDFTAGSYDHRTFVLNAAIGQQSRPPRRSPHQLVSFHFLNH
ncbi:hypothetical protein BDQ12DRAFT_681973 [Crucibulum laeve]|uniref:Uncharacterized protein n=1 Tax=Crucibulum laeve TaxID=68775 RepID=A0A5C3M2E5_9AGAR|nr:hypothetical protein BDQ12DRAFT_681973 [Crucibulum laeve]